MIIFYGCKANAHVLIAFKPADAAKAGVLIRGDVGTSTSLTMQVGVFGMAHAGAVAQFRAWLSAVCLTLGEHNRKPTGV